MLIKMNIYVFLLISNILIFACLNGKFDKPQINKLVLIFFILTWGSIMAFRDIKVGTDTENYCLIFSRIAQMNVKDMLVSQETNSFFVYSLYNKLLSLISKKQQVVIIANSFIFVVGTVLFLYKNSNNFSASLFYFLTFGFYFEAMNTARQSIACMLVLWVYHYSIRKKYKASIIFLLIAVFVHQTAIVGILILILSNVKIDKLKIFSIIAIGAFLAYLYDWLVSWFIYIFPRYGGYLKSGYVEAHSDGNRIYLAIFLLIIITLCFILKDNQKILHQDKNIFMGLLAITIISIMFMIVLRHNAISARIERYFSYFIMIFIPYCFETMLSYKRKYFMYFGTGMFFIILFLIRIQPFLPYYVYKQIEY